MDPTEKKHRVKLPDGIFERIAGGDNKAFEELYYLTYKPLYAFLFSLTKNQEDAEDILQDTYLKIKGASHLYKEQGNPMAWIMKIGKNEFLMRCRKKQDMLTEDIETYENVDIAVSEFTGSIDNRMFLAEMFGRISEEDRNIIILHIVGGMKHREIADFLDKPLGSVLTRYHRAIKLLRETEKNRKEVSQHE